MISIKSKSEIEKMREACRIVMLAHREVENAIRIGITTRELDQIVERVFKENGANTSFKVYQNCEKNPFQCSIFI